MSRPIGYLNQELPGYALQRQAWIREMEADGRGQEQSSMEMLVYWVGLGIASTFCLLAWVLW